MITCSTPLKLSTLILWFNLILLNFCLAIPYLPYKNEPKALGFHALDIESSSELENQRRIRVPIEPSQTYKPTLHSNESDSKEVQLKHKKFYNKEFENIEKILKKSLKSKHTHKKLVKIGLSTLKILDSAYNQVNNFRDCGNKLYELGENVATFLVNPKVWFLNHMRKLAVYVMKDLRTKQLEKKEIGFKYSNSNNDGIDNLPIGDNMNLQNTHNTSESNATNNNIPVQATSVTDAVVKPNVNGTDSAKISVSPETNVEKDNAANVDVPIGTSATKPEITNTTDTKEKEHEEGKRLTMQIGQTFDKLMMQIENLAEEVRKEEISLTQSSTPRYENGSKEDEEEEEEEKEEDEDEDNGNRSNPRINLNDFKNTNASLFNNLLQSVDDNVTQCIQNAIQNPEEQKKFIDASLAMSNMLLNVKGIRDLMNTTNELLSDLKKILQYPTLMKAIKDVTEKKISENELQTESKPCNNETHAHSPESLENFPNNDKQQFTTDFTLLESFEESTSFGEYISFEDSTSLGESVTVVNEKLVVEQAPIMDVMDQLLDALLKSNNSSDSVIILKKLHNPNAMGEMSSKLESQIKNSMATIQSELKDFLDKVIKESLDENLKRLKTSYKMKGKIKNCRKSINSNSSPSLITIATNDLGKVSKMNIHHAITLSLLQNDKLTSKLKPKSEKMINLPSTEDNLKEFVKPEKYISVCDKNNSSVNKDRYLDIEILPIMGNRKKKNRN